MHHLGGDCELQSTFALIEYSTMNCGRPNADPSRALTAQFGMTPEEAELIVRIIQEKDPSLESLKHPKVQEMILERKGRWSRVS